VVIGTWPVLSMPAPDGTIRRPVITDKFRHIRANHNGVDVMFRRIAADRPFIRSGADDRGSKAFYAPDGMTTIAWRAGIVARAPGAPPGGMVERDPSD
jgi:hypothetical protein